MVPEMRAFGVVVGKPSVEIGLQRFDGLVEGLAHFHTKVLVEHGAVEALDKAAGLWRFDPGAAVLDAGEVEIEFANMPLDAPKRPNERWSLDFLSDVFELDRRLRILAVIDDCTRESLGLVADTSLSGVRVARELDAIIRLYGKPKTIVSDNVLCGENLAA